MLGGLRRGKPKTTARWGAEPPRRSRARRFHLAALLSAAVYLGAAVVAYELYRSAWLTADRVAGGAADAGAVVQGAVLGVQVERDLSSQERAALRALAGRAQQSVFVVVTPEGEGAGFVAWTKGGDSFVITAHRVAAGVLERGERAVTIRRGSQTWDARIIRASKPSGMVLVRVDGVLARPLWQARAVRDVLAAGGPALVVPPGGATGIGEGVAGQLANDRIRVRAHGERLSIGAPVIGANGRIAGLVAATEPGGVDVVVPIDLACAAEIRFCS